MTASTGIRFIDVFAGCGGLSLGLLRAGCNGVFAVEKNPLAFETLRFNLVDGTRYQFDWPEWLPKQAMTCEDLLLNYGQYLVSLQGQIDLIVGGPPCQGFSIAGRRDPADPRNRMTEQYLMLVELLKPRFLVIENVAGFDMQFENEDGLERLIEKEETSYAEYVEGRLYDLGYGVSRGLINCADFGVPQNRLRYLMLCELKSQAHDNQPELLELLRTSRENFLLSIGLPTDRYISAQEAIFDLETSGREMVRNEDSKAKGFLEAKYVPPKGKQAYLKLMRQYSGLKDTPNSRRLANHKPRTIEYFKRVQAICRPGVCLSKTERAMVGRKKHSTTVLNAGMPSPTITTLPDDIIHYKEPRILTVRENARLQSFPDWFAFQGKYTTGGKQRKHDCPRYTQVGNAVPPLLAMAIGMVLETRVLEVAGHQREVVNTEEQDSALADFTSCEVIPA